MMNTEEQSVAEDSAASKALDIIRPQPDVINIRLNLRIPRRPRWRRLDSLFLYAVAVICAFAGNWKWQERDYYGGEPWLWLGFGLWILAEVYEKRREILAWWRGQNRTQRVRWLARIVPLGLALSGFVFLAWSMSGEGETVFGYHKELLDGETVLALLGSALVRFALAGALWIAIDIAAWLTRRSEHDQNGYTVVISKLHWRNKTVDALSSMRENEWRRVSPKRTLHVALAIISSVIVWINSSDNYIAPPIIILWLVSARLWYVAFNPGCVGLVPWARQKREAIRGFDWRAHKWTIAAFAAVMAIGVYFRFAQLDTLPREMYMDHAFNAYDIYDISQGQYKIMFSHGSEAIAPIHKYLTFLLSTSPGLGDSFDTLKLMAAIESLLTLPLLLWVGMEYMQGKNRKYALLAGLIMVGFAASSYWHVVISRYALRTHLAAPFAALAMVYLVRTVRHNRRSDFCMCGLVMGFGFYSYLATRVLPLAALGAVLVALVFFRHSAREKVKYLLHFAVLCFLCLMMLLPMIHVAIDSPDFFWKLFSINLAGQETFGEQTLEIVQGETVAIVLNNVRKTLLMFSWEGDNDWIHSFGRKPVLDIYAGAFLIVGVAALLIRIVKSKDIGLWIVPAIFICMLPTVAFSLHMHWAIPDNTRINVAIPVIYLIAALPAAIIARKLRSCFPGRLGKSLALVFCGAAILLSAHENRKTYFTEFAANYVVNSPPYSEMGAVLRGFVDSDGAYANVLILAGGHQLMIATEADAIPHFSKRWIRNNIPHYLIEAKNKEGEYQLQLDRDLLIINYLADESVATMLRDMFPQGRELRIEAYNGKEYLLYRVPALGEDGWSAFAAKHNLGS